MVKSDKARSSAAPSPWDLAIACMLLTRLPLPALPAALFVRQARAAWAFPLAGLAVAAVAALAGWIALGLGLGAGAAAGLVLAAQILATGAMHEDGLADSADGLWGGHDRVRRLAIMKDSTIGTYGVLALVLSLGLRWIALAALIPAGFGAVFAAAALSRGLLPGIMTALPPARPNGLARSVGAPGWDVSAVALLIGLSAALAAAGMAALVPALAALLVLGGVALLAMARIGGQTGDILGAAQQLAEITLLLGLMAAAGG